ncbi:MAG: hypothetical protein AAF317_17175 [Pseudomonadota bacterium]
MRLALALLALILSASWSAAADKENYYYPPINSEESFSRSITDTPPPTNRSIRVAFMTEITKAQLAAPETPRFAVFAKGSDAEHMIIIALDDEVFKTLFRARAVLAQLTSNARGTDFFIKAGIAAQATWFDLAKLLGFEDIVISDGNLWSHKIVLK